MAEINAQTVKKLRDMTGAGMMECKKALEKAGGDLEKAVDELRKQGMASAAKKADRSAKQGVIGSYIADDGQLGVQIEVNCESDFVARTDDFQGLVRDLARHIAAANPQGVRAGEASGPALLEQPFFEDSSVTVENLIQQKIAKLGENIIVARFARFADRAGQPGAIGNYIHAGSQLGVMVEVNCGSAAAAREADFQDLVKDLAMHIAAADPKFLRRSEVAEDVLEKEREIARDRAKNEGKPEKIWPKIVEGRLEKFFEEVCLLEQPFIKENTITIEELIKQRSTKLGASIEVVRFVRFKVGETAAPAGDSPDAAA